MRVVRGYLLIQGNSKLQYITNELKQKAKNAYWEYKKEKAAWECHGCLYEKYMQYVIDGCIAQQAENSEECDDESKNTESQPLINDTTKENLEMCNIGRVQVNSCSNYDLSDCNIPTKKVRYLAFESTDFRFIGPDRLLVTIDSIDKCLQVGKIARNTCLPNYRMTRISLTSGLNIPAWERVLQGYPDDRLLQHIKFGFPLSLRSSDNLHNQEVLNHFSARQYPEDIQK